MLEEGGDARGMPALGEKPLLAMGSYHTCQVFMWKQDQMIRAGALAAIQRPRRPTISIGKQKTFSSPYYSKAIGHVGSIFVAPPSKINQEEELCQASLGATRRTRICDLI